MRMPISFGREAKEAEACDKHGKKGKRDKHAPEALFRLVLGVKNVVEELVFERPVRGKRGPGFFQIPDSLRDPVWRQLDREKSEVVIIYPQCHGRHARLQSKVVDVFCNAHNLPLEPPEAGAFAEARFG